MGKTNWKRLHEKQIKEVNKVEIENELLKSRIEEFKAQNALSSDAFSLLTRKSHELEDELAKFHRDHRAMKQTIVALGEEIRKLQE